jgi:serine/threonine-protein kinase
MPEDTLPGRVGRFEIRRELGRGTMGVVFEAHDLTLHRTVALKVIRLAFAATSKERQDFERRFLTEARAAAGLSHPGIVVVHEAGRDEASGMLYLALEHLVGQSLESALAQKGRFEETEALRIAAQVARALDYAHRRGVVHRDIKPANVMLLPDGQVKILDFGLAKVETGHEQTAAGQFLGTPLFVSPEQALGLKVDGRSDLFSLGAILYTLLAGRRPFEGETLARILARVAHQPPKPLREVSAAVSAAAEAVTLRALAKSPDDRHPTGAAMAEDLEDVLAGRPLRHPAPPLPRETQAADAARADGQGRTNEGTVVAKAAGLESLPELVLDERPAARKRRRVPLRALSLLLLLGGLAIYFWSISGSERLAEAIAPFLTSLSRSLSAGEQPSPARAAVTLPASPSATVPEAGESVPAAPGSIPTGETPARDTPLSPTPPEATAEPSGAGTSPSSAPEPTPGPVSNVAEADPEAATPTTDPGEEEDPVLLPDEDEPRGADAESAAASLRVPPEPPIPEPTPTPSGPASGAPPSRSSSASPRPETPATAELAIRLEHPLTKGTVRVWLDEELVLRAALGSVVSKKVLFFSFRSGRVRETLQVRPGKRRLRVEVRGKGRSDAEQVVAEFRPGARRRLDVREGKSRGRLAFIWR